MSKQVKRYRCIKTFSVDNYNLDGDLLEIDVNFVRKGSIWHLSLSDFVDCEVSLENEDLNSKIPWLGCSRQILDRYFKEIDNETC